MDSECLDVAQRLFLLSFLLDTRGKKKMPPQDVKKKKEKKRETNRRNQSFLMFSFSRRYMCAVWWRLKHLPSCWQHLTKKRKKKKWVKSKDRKWKRIQGNNGCHVICKKGANIQAQTGRKSVRTLYVHTVVANGNRSSNAAPATFLWRNAYCIPSSYTITWVICRATKGRAFNFGLLFLTFSSFVCALFFISLRRSPILLPPLAC